MDGCVVEDNIGCVFIVHIQKLIKVEIDLFFGIPLQIFFIWEGLNT